MRKMIMKRTCMFLFVLGMRTAIWGGESVSQAMYQAIDEYSKNVQIDFTTRTYLSALEEWVASSGFLEVSGSRYRLQASGLEWVSNGKTLWKYSKGNKQIVIHSAESQAPPSRILLDFFNGTVQSVEEGDQGLKVLLETEGVLKTYSKIEMLLEKDTYIPKKIHTWDFEDNQSVYIVKEFKFNVSFAKNHFVFPVEQFVQKNPEIEVINTEDE